MSSLFIAINVIPYESYALVAATTTRSDVECLALVTGGGALARTHGTALHCGHVDEARLHV